MAARDYDVAPLSEHLALDKVISGLANDLEELRAGKISVNDAIARSLLAKQIFNGVRIYLNGTKILSDNARPAGRAALQAERGEGNGSRSLDLTRSAET